MKKKINDYILNNYNELFFTNAKPASASKADLDENMIETGDQKQTATAEEILSNSKLQKYAEEELRLSDEAGKNPRDLL